MAAIVLHVVHRRLIAVKQGMLAVVERLVGLMICSDEVVCPGVRPGLRVMPLGGFMMPGGHCMMRRATEIRR